MSIQLSAGVWRDLTSSFFQWEGAAAVRELVSAEKRTERRAGGAQGGGMRNYIGGWDTVGRA